MSGARDGPKARSPLGRFSAPRRDITCWESGTTMKTRLARSLAVSSLGLCAWTALAGCGSDTPPPSTAPAAGTTATVPAPPAVVEAPTPVEAPMPVVAADPAVTPPSATPAVSVSDLDDRPPAPPEDGNLRQTA